MKAKADPRMEQPAIARLTRNGGRIMGKEISFEKPGLKNLGAIDCLCNYFGYYWKGHLVGQSR